MIFIVAVVFAFYGYQAGLDRAYSDAIANGHGYYVEKEFKWEDKKCYLYWE